MRLLSQLRIVDTAVQPHRRLIGSAAGHHGAHPCRCNHSYQICVSSWKKKKLVSRRKQEACDQGTEDMNTCRSVCILVDAIMIFRLIFSFLFLFSDEPTPQDTRTILTREFGIALARCAELSRLSFIFFFRFRTVVQCRETRSEAKLLFGSFLCDEAGGALAAMI